MRTCPLCGNLHPDDAVFCPETGGRIPPPDLSHAASAQQVIEDTVVPSPADSWQPLAVKVMLAVLGIGLVLMLAGAWLVFRPFSDRETSSAQVGPRPGFIPTRTAAPAATSSQNNRQGPQQDGGETPAPTATAAPTLAPTPTLAATATPIPPTPTPAFTPTPSFQIKGNEKDGAAMVFVEAGPFTMGSDPGVDPYFWGAESPQFTVNMDAFWIYQTEVTNAMYRACAVARACPVPMQKKSRSHKDYYENPLYDNYPVIYVNYTMAGAYCDWAGGRLPTEAEWEKAARGSADARLFPWGDNPAESRLANFCDQSCLESSATSGVDDGYPETAPVGSYPAGVSPYGALDMAGNVWEWVFDWFVPTYQTSLNDNPRGPASGKYRGIRGGGWGNPAAGVRIVQRDGVRPDISLDVLGFRCAVDVGD